MRISTNRPKEAAALPGTAQEVGSSANHAVDDESASVSAESSAISESEADNLRMEKLAAIRQAIADGAYDSDDLLLRALDRMRAAIQDDAESSS